MDLLLARVLELGARLARPGEFSERAFLNDKLDLVQAEAIADLIDSGSSQAARAAMRSLQGEFSKRVHDLSEQLVTARTFVEAAIEFAEEEVDFLNTQELREQLENLASGFADTLVNAQQGALLREGMTVVIAGKPNAGKSSLLNALAGYDAAIVSAVPGTTRDVLRERVTVDGMPLHIIDTAGLRTTEDVVETEGIRRAHREMAKADCILYLVDSTQLMSIDELQDEMNALPQNIPVTVLYNKIDLAPAPRTIRSTPTFSISAHTRQGLDELRAHLKDCMGLRESSATTFSARRRHLDALRRGEQRVQTALQLLKERRAGELTAEELRLAQRDIGEITGEFASDDLLGRIFSTFCIGK
jgi:tRNA modification GTPase